MSTAAILLAALVLDRVIGDPDWLWRRWPHPVVWIGNVIGWANRRFNRESDSSRKREKAGFAVVGILIIAAVIAGQMLDKALALAGSPGTVIEIVIVAVFLAQKSLAEHVAAVAQGLRAGGLAGGRKAVSMIVGRDPERLDVAGVSRAAVESLAENASDGVVAPAFWYLVFGLPGLLAYKVINTADSMIGHKTPRHLAFGRASAQIDDLANWVPARLTALLILLAGGFSRFKERALIVWRDAKLHRSPNAGWPESAMAAVMGLALGGPRIYKDDVANEPFMNGSGRQVSRARDIDRALDVFDRAMILGWAAVTAVLVLA